MRTLALASLLVVSLSLAAQTNNAQNPTWWNKYQYLSTHAPLNFSGPATPLTAGANVDVSNECGPQSETFITLNRNNPSILAGGSNEIFRLPMRGYFSSDGGLSWGGVDLPLPTGQVHNGIRFGSDPTLAVDSQGNVYYGYIVVFFSAGNGINGTEMAVAKSTDGGATYSQVTYFSPSTGQDHFNDKPMITADSNPSSPFRDNVYIAWDSANGGSSSGGVRVGRSTDGGQTFAISRADNPSGAGKAIAAVPFTGNNGELYVAWNDYQANAIVFNRSTDGGATWGTPVTVASKVIPFAIAIPAEFSRGALVYPACDTDHSGGAHNGRLYCSWMDLTPAGTTDILLASSDNGGASWTSPVAVTDQFTFAVDRFNHWLSVDAVTGDVNISFYDTRNDTTGFRFQTDTYLSRSSDGGASFAPNTRVTTVSSNEHDCAGLFPCLAINYGNQQGDYEGLVAHGGVAHPIWTDSRNNQNPASGCKTSLVMEEVFTARVQ